MNSKQKETQNYRNKNALLYYFKLFSLILVLRQGTCGLGFVASETIQKSLEMEPTIEDFDDYLESYIKDNQKLALLLDYDGTLAAICAHPNFTEMTPITTEVLKSLAANPNIFMAVISGRGVENVRNKVDIDGIVYAGNHGLEIFYPNGTTYNHQIPTDVSDNYTKLVEELEQTVAKNGAWIENKGVSLTFHFRQTPEELHEDIKNKATEIIKRYGYNDNQAHLAIEAKPPVQWNKGFAAEYILKHSFGDNWREEIKVIFAGDDTTDEDIMKVLKGHGVSFRVTNNMKQETFANYRIPSTESVTTLLKWIQKKFNH